MVWIWIEALSKVAGYVEKVGLHGKGTPQLPFIARSERTT
jgi:hypothetical protein